MSYSRSELYGNAKLSPAQVRDIRARGAAGERPRDLGREFRVAPETIRKILRWDTYTMVPEVEVVSTRPPPSDAEVAASQARLLALLGPVVESKPMPTLEESLAAAAQESDAVTAKVEAAVKAREAAVDAQLAGLLSPNVIPYPIPHESSGTDGGSK